MFSQPKRANAGQVKRDPSKEYAVTIITSGCHFSGKLFCKGSTRIGGKVEGEIVSEGLLIIEEDASIAADVKAEDIVIQGYFKGIVEASGKVEMSGTCVFVGDVITPILVVQEGAQFNGRTTMDPSRIVEKQSGQSSDDRSIVTPILASTLASGEEFSEGERRVPEINAHL